MAVWNNGTNNIPEQLKEWATNVLNVPGLDENSDLSHVCRGEMSAVWKHMIHNVVSKETASTVHGNLCLYQTQVQLGAQHPGNLRQKYNALVERVNMQRAEVLSLERNLEVVKLKHSASIRVRQDSMQAYHDDGVKAELLKGHQVYINQQMVMLCKYRDSLQNLLNKYRSTKRKGITEQYFHSQSSPKRQNHCIDELQSIHTEVLSLLNALLQGNIGRSEVQSKTCAIGQRVRVLLDGYGPSNVMNYLIHGIRLSQEKVQEDTQSIDVVKDAEMLRFKFVQTNLIDESDEPPLSEGVAQLMEQRQIEHQKRFLETERLRASISASQQKVEAMKERFSQRLSMSLTTKDDRIPVIRELIDTEMRAKQCTVEIKILKTVCKNLHEEVSAVSHQVRTIQAKHLSITSFKGDVQAKQNKICVLMKQNTESKRKLDVKRIALLKVINTLVSNEEPTIVAGSSALKKSLTEEVEMFQELPLGCIVTNPHLSITELQNVTGAARSNIDIMLQHLSHNSYLSPDALVCSILKMKKDIRDSHLSVPEYTVKSEEEGSCVTDLMTTVHSYKESQMKSLLPLLSNGLKHAADGLHRCEKMKLVAEHWFHQPALRLNI